MFTEIDQYIAQCTTLQSIDIEHFNAQLIHKKYPAKTLLLNAGEVCQFEGFVKKGCIKTYCIDQNGFEVILNFATENWWVSDVTSFQEQTPARMFIETIEETELLILTPRAKEKILRDIPQLERMFRLMVQRHLSSLQDRLYSLIAQSAEERYRAFLQKHPTLEQRVPQYLIASYLGITPEFLSRLRKKKTPHGSPGKEISGD